MLKSRIGRFLGVHGKLSFEPDFNTPISEKAVNRLIGKINDQRSFQSAAATSAADILWQADFAGTIGDLYVTVNTLPGAGETMTFDVLKNGVSILTSGPFTVNSSSVVTDQISLYSSINPTSRSFNVGDVYTVNRVYTAGAPAPMGGNTLVIEPTNKPWK